jgi:hypothetical protein
MIKIFAICMVILFTVLPGLSAAGILTDNGNGTVTDNGTHLTWQQGESSTTLTWGSALTYCEGLSLAGVTDWRLPNHKELMSLFDYTKNQSLISPTVIPNTTTLYYWSSTTSSYSASTAAFSVYFGEGSSSTLDKNYSTRVRCVRGGQ